MTQENITNQPEGLFTEGLETYTQPMDISMEETPFSEINALNIIQTPTNPAWKKQRVSSGKSLDYISGDTVTRLLNKAFRYRWSFYILETRMVESQDKIQKSYNNEPPKPSIPQLPVVQVHGRLVVPGWGVREQWGAQPLSGGSDVQEHAFKSAATDAMKKCASMFGIALDLYGQEGIDELAVTPNDFLVDDEKVLANIRKQMKLSAEQRKQQAEAVKTETPKPVVAPSEQPAPAVQAGPVQEHQEPEAIPQMEAAPVQQEFYQQPPMPVETVQQPEMPAPPAQPEPVQQPVTTQGTSSWNPDDIMKLKTLKTKLGILDNRDLDVFVAEFFQSPDARYINIRPDNIHDFNSFLESKLNQ